MPSRPKNINKIAKTPLKKGLREELEKTKKELQKTKRTRINEWYNYTEKITLNRWLKLNVNLESLRILHYFLTLDSVQRVTLLDDALKQQRIYQGFVCISKIPLNFNEFTTPVMGHEILYSKKKIENGEITLDLLNIRRCNNKQCFNKKPASIMMEKKIEEIWDFTFKNHGFDNIDRSIREKHSSLINMAPVIFAHNFTARDFFSNFNVKESTKQYVYSFVVLNASESNTISQKNLCFIDKYGILLNFDYFENLNLQKFVAYLKSKNEDMNIFAIFENIQERLSYELEIETKKLEKLSPYEISMEGSSLDSSLASEDLKELSVFSHNFEEAEDYELIVRDENGKSVHLDDSFLATDNTLKSRRELEHKCQELAKQIALDREEFSAVTEDLATMRYSRDYNESKYQNFLKFFNKFIATGINNNDNENQEPDNSGISDKSSFLGGSSSAVSLNSSKASEILEELIKNKSISPSTNES